MAAPLLGGVIADQGGVDVRAHQGKGLFFQVGGFAAEPLGLDLEEGLLRGVNLPELMKGVHVERQGIELAVGEGLGGIDVVVEVGEAVHEIPNHPVAGVEDVSPVGVHIDAVPCRGVAVATDVGPFVNQQAASARVGGQPGEGGAVEAATDNQIVIGGAVAPVALQSQGSRARVFSQVVIAREGGPAAGGWASDGPCAPDPIWAQANTIHRPGA